MFDMMRRFAILAVAAALPTGCSNAPHPDPAPDPKHPPSGKCNAAAAQSFVGQKADDETGAAILKRADAKTLRWGPPRSPWTMDYRRDRVNVRYDDEMIITAVTCG